MTYRYLALRQRRLVEQLHSTDERAVGHMEEELPLGLEKTTPERREKITITTIVLQTRRIAVNKRGLVQKVFSLLVLAASVGCQSTGQDAAVSSDQTLIHVNDAVISSDSNIIVDFSIKNSGQKSICVFENIVSSASSFQIDLVLRDRKTKRVYKRSAIGYIPPYSDTPLQIAPGEGATGRLSFGGWPYLSAKQTVGLELKLWTIGADCPDRPVTPTNGDLRFESEWHPVSQLNPSP